MQVDATVYVFIAVAAIISVTFAVLWLRARASLAVAAEERTRLLDATTVGIFVVDRQGRITHANQTAAGILGRTAGELRGTDFGQLLKDGESHALLHASGAAVPVEYSAAPIDCGTVVTFTDTTERRRLEARLEQARRIDSLGRLAATIAHEFNNVLMGIQPFVEFLRRESVTAEAKLKAIHHITNSIQRGKRITGDILRFTHSADPVPGTIDLDRWLASFTVEMSALLGSAYEVATDVRGQLFMHADAGQLVQGLTNLVLNARDAMPRGGKIVIAARQESPETHFAFGTVQHPERFVHLSVSDTGTGIAPEVLEHIFEPLFTTKRNGTGLGLAVLHRIVDRNHGEIFVESALGGGTTFHIFVPAAEKPDGMDSAAGREPQQPQSTKVLLVEDDASVAGGLVALLEEEGMSVESVSTGTEALAALRERKPDAIILDIGLPDMDGRTLYDRIAAMYPAMPVVFSTAHVDKSRFEDVLASCPRTRMLLKPYDGETLIAALGDLTAVQHEPDKIAP